MSGEFVARMEDVLDLYQPEYNPERPVVCFDETSRQLTGEVRPPIEAAPGRVARYDTEYQRNGTRNLFMICEPKGGWRHVEVTERRTAVDFAHQMRWLVDEAYPDAEVVRLVLDNLNTHQLGSLYEAFEPCEARRIAQRLEFHYTPTHGSWLNMAEIELSVFSRGCLNRRISDEPELRREVAALERERNAAKSPKKLNPSTTSVMATPGKTTSGQCGIRTLATAPPSIFPQVEVGGGIPTPRKPREDSIIMATPRCAEASTRKGAMHWGAMWRDIIRRLDTPIAWAART